MYNYNFRSPIRLYQNFGNFGGDYTEKDDLVNIATHIDGYLAGWAQMQLSFQIKAFNNDAIKSSAYKDCVTVRLNFYNSANTAETMTLVIPCFQTGQGVKGEAGYKSAGVLKDELGEWIALQNKLRNKNGVLMDSYKASGVSVVRDVFAVDTASTNKTD